MAPIVYGDLINTLIKKERCAMPWWLMYQKEVQDSLTLLCITERQCYKLT